MATERSFILGVGAQKAGTSWLYEQLCKSSNFQTGLTKEYHIFDALHLRKCKFFKSQIEQNAARTNATEADALLVRFLADTDNYFNYFDELIGAGQIAADITPTYSGLSANVYTEIREKFRERGISVKAVFLMREPISRLVSATKMHFRIRDKNFEREDFLEKMTNTIKNGMDDLRSQYPETCRNLEAVFDANNLHLGFYETMFEQSNLTRLAQFLDIDASIFNANDIVHKSAEDFFLTPSEWERYREHYNDRYEFVRKNFARQSIEPLWQKTSLGLIAAEN